MKIWNIRKNDELTHLVAKNTFFKARTSIFNYLFSLDAVFRWVSHLSHTYGSRIIFRSNKSAHFVPQNSSIFKVLNLIFFSANKSQNQRLKFYWKYL